MSTDRLPPHSSEAEAGALGCVLQAPLECLGECVERLRGPEAFYEMRHRTIYQALVSMQERGQAIDLITLQQTLKDQAQLEAVGGLAYLSSLPDQVPSAANLEYYLEIVREKHLLRRLVQQCTNTVAKAYEWEGTVDTLVDEFERNAMELRNDKETGTVHTGRKLALDFINDCDERCARQGQLTGLATGFPRFDEIIEGIQFKEQTIIAARPSQGKTAIGLNIVRKVCLVDRVPTAIISLEMSRQALLRRLCAAHCDIPLKAIRQGWFEETMKEKLTIFSVLLKNAPLFIYDRLRGATADRIAAIVRRLVRSQGVRFVLVDYLQKLKASGRYEKRTYEVGEVSGVLKAMAEENNIALLTLAQLSREPEKDKGRQPRLSDLADSAQIERDADIIAFIHRDRGDESMGRDALLIVAKQRDGETGAIPLIFNGAFCRFESPNKLTPDDLAAVANVKAQ
jgi:replicative DNA helicase